MGNVRQRLCEDLMKCSINEDVGTNGNGQALTNDVIAQYHEFYAGGYAEGPATGHLLANLSRPGQERSKRAWDAGVADARAGRKEMNVDAFVAWWNSGS